VSETIDGSPQKCIVLVLYFIKGAFLFGKQVKYAHKQSCKPSIINRYTPCTFIYLSPKQIINTLWKICF